MLLIFNFHVLQIRIWQFESVKFPLMIECKEDCHNHIYITGIFNYYFFLIIDLNVSSHLEGW